MKTYNITKLFLTLCTCVCATFAMAQVNENDLQELVNFYNTNCGPGCTLDWDFNQSISTWEEKGIKINPDGTVYDMYLTNKGLTGSIPNFNLPELRRMVLDSNELTGVIPDFDHLDMLDALSLRHNQLNGEIPNFSNFPIIKSLYLGHNDLNGEVPDFNQMLNLRSLQLESNELIGKIPDFSTLVNLENISLVDNQLTGTIPDFNLPMLEYLYLQSNGLTGTIPDFDNLVSLKYITLAQNELTGSIPDFSNSPDLILVYLQYNKLSGIVPDFSRVSYLNIKYNEFSYQDIETNFANKNNTIFSFVYDKQYFGDRQFHTKEDGDNFDLEPKPAIPYQNPDVQWIKDSYYATDPTPDNATFTIDDMDMEDIGIYRYTFEVSSADSPPLTVKYTSRPIYVYIDGYDLSGAPVIPGELVIDYGKGRSLTEIDSLRNDLIINYGGTLLDSCGCSVTVDLWQFPDFIDEVREDLGIDGGSEKRLGDADLDGGENRNTQQQLSYTPHNGEQIAVNFSALSPGQGTVVIGVLDTGLDTAHPDITSNVWDNSEELGNNDEQNCYANDMHGYNFVGSTGNIYDDHGHGTHVGGVIAANVPQEIDVKVMPIKTFDNEGNGTMYDMICGIHYAMDNGADIINISAGYAGHKAPVFQKTIQYGREKDVIFVVSAGNDNIDLDEHDYWPASFSRDTLLTNTMITVTSLDATYNLSDDVGYGDTTVTVAAQGEGILSPKKDGGYDYFTGTSISTPLVALALGIEKTQNPDRDYTTLRSDFLNGLSTMQRLTDYVENGRVLTLGINNLTDIVINPEDVCVGESANNTSFSIYSDLDFEISTDAEWVELQLISDDRILNIEYGENEAGESRVATIIVTNGAITRKGYLIQKGTQQLPTDLDVTTNESYINGTLYKTASSAITANGIIETDATVRYSAGNHIIMSDGFHAKPGSSFLATIGVCQPSDNKEEQLIPQISLRSYPNPFNTQTTIEYSLFEDSKITLIISDIAGRQITVPINGETKPAGTHKVIFDGTQLPSGMYYYTIKTGDYFGTQKMILAK